MPTNKRRVRGGQEVVSPVLEAGIRDHQERDAVFGLNFLIGATETELDADRIWFDANPKRNHRIRPTFPNEKIIREVTRGLAFDIAPDFAIYTAVERMSEGVLCRAWFWGAAGIRCDAIPENGAAYVFDACFRSL